MWWQCWDCPKMSINLSSAISARPEILRNIRSKIQNKWFWEGWMPEYRSAMLKPTVVCFSALQTGSEKTPRFTRHSACMLNFKEGPGTCVNSGVLLTFCIWHQRIRCQRMSKTCVCCLERCKILLIDIFWAWVSFFVANPSRQSPQDTVGHCYRTQVWCSIAKLCQLRRGYWHIKCNLMLLRHAQFFKTQGSPLGYRGRKTNNDSVHSDWY